MSTDPTRETLDPGSNSTGAGPQQPLQASFPVPQNTDSAQVEVAQMAPVSPGVSSLSTENTPNSPASAPTVSTAGENVPLDGSPSALAGTDNVAQDENTDPLATDQLNGNEDSIIRNTIPLAESAAPPVPPLSENDTLDDRYQIIAFLGADNGTNVYRVQDRQGYRRCWACGSTASVQGETYCVDCGAQLTGRYYRLQEFNMPAGIDPNELGDVAMALLPQPLLENQVPGVVHVYDALAGSDRAYIVWEEVSGRPLSAWVGGTDNGGTVIPVAPGTTSGQLPSMEEPESEQAIFWMAQAADILRQLHANGITGCRMTLDNIVVQPGDRLTVVDAMGCTQPASPELGTAMAADVRALASELETWYMAVREETVQVPDVEQAQESALVPGADDMTGPLNSISNPAIVLSKAREGVYPTAEEFSHALFDLYENNKPLNNLLLWTGRASNVGRVRQINEDSVMTLEVTVLEHEDSTPAGVFVIADGMGGHQSGEVASSIAARTIGGVVNAALLSSLVEGDPVSTSSSGLSSLLQNAVMEANRRICDLARERHSDLGTTVTMALLLGSQLTVANVGDSRTYLLRDGKLAPITRDHSLVAQLVAAGQLAPDDIYTHPRRNEIYRALGDPHLTEAEIDVFSLRVQPGDSVLLCSDGLWDFVRDPVIQSIIMAPENTDPQAACTALIDKANSMGGEDNISTILIKVLQIDEG